jgi:hypothetical protein
VFPAGDEVVTRSVYEDAGDGYGPASRFSVTVDASAVRVSAREGGYVPPYGLELSWGSETAPVSELPFELTLR